MYSEHTQPTSVCAIKYGSVPRHNAEQKQYTRVLERGRGVWDMFFHTHTKKKRKRKGKKGKKIKTETPKQKAKNNQFIISSFCPYKYLQEDFPPPPPEIKKGGEVRVEIKGWGGDGGKKAERDQLGAERGLERSVQCACCPPCPSACPYWELARSSTRRS